MKKETYLIRKIGQDGNVDAYFTLDIDGVVMLLNMATPGKCKFEIEKI